MSVQQHRLSEGRKQFTPLAALQMFAGGLILTVVVLTVFIISLKLFYNWDPAPTGFHVYSPIYSIGGAAVCLVLSFLIPELLLDSARRELKKDNAREQGEDLPFVFVPSIFIRYALLAIVTMIGFLMVFSGRGLMVFLPFSVISLILMGIYFPTETRMKMWLNSR